MPVHDLCGRYFPSSKVLARHAKICGVREHFCLLCGFPEAAHDKPRKTKEKLKICDSYIASGIPEDSPP